MGDCHWDLQNQTGGCSRGSQQDTRRLFPLVTCTRWAPPRHEAAAPALPLHDPPIPEPNTNPFGLRLVPWVPMSTPGPVSCGLEGEGLVVPKGKCSRSGWTEGRGGSPSPHLISNAFHEGAGSTCAETGPSPASPE